MNENQPKEQDIFKINEELKTKVNNYEIIISKAKKIALQLNNDKTKLNNEKTKLLSDIEEIKNEKNQNLDLIEQLRKQIIEYQKESENDKNFIEQMKNEINGYKKDSENDQNLIKQLKTETSGSQTTSKNYQVLIEQLKNEILEYKKDSENDQNLIKQLKTETSGSQTTSKNYQVLIEQLKNEILEYKKDSENYQNLIKQLKNENNQYNHSIVKYKKDNENDQNLIQSLQNEIVSTKNANQNHINEYQKAIKQLQKEKTLSLELMKNINNLTLNTNQDQKTINKLKQEIDTLKNSQNQNDILHQLQEDSQTKDQTIFQLQTDIKTKNQDNQHLLEQIEELKKDYETQMNSQPFQKTQTSKGTDPIPNAKDSPIYQDSNESISRIQELEELTQKQAKTIENIKENAKKAIFQKLTELNNKKEKIISGLKTKNQEMTSQYELSEEKNQNLLLQNEKFQQKIDDIGRLYIKKKKEFDKLFQHYSSSIPSSSLDDLHSSEIIQPETEKILDQDQNKDVKENEEIIKPLIVIHKGKGIDKTPEKINASKNSLSKSQIFFNFSKS